jgi:cytochrome c oxidase subunit 1
MSSNAHVSNLEAPAPLSDSARALAQQEHRNALERTWCSRGGLWGWLTDVSYRSLGKRFVVTAFGFFLLGGLEALAMRLQLARPEAKLIGPDLYNQIFTVHGSTMMFLFAVPIMGGVGICLVPPMIGTRNVTFPRLNAFSYYVYLIGGGLLYVSFAFNAGPDAGWFSYVPLSGPQFAPGKRVDVWAQMVTFTEVSSLGVAVNLIATILKQRAPGMSLSRIPLFCWAMLVMSFMVVFAMPAVMLASTCLALDRLVGTQFFNPAEGGDVLLWQHLFWFFGHPEVYIIFIPALGMVSAIVATFSRREVFGYLAMVLSLVATAFIGFGLWVHHMFATGLPQVGQSFFTAASIMIAVPSGVQIFCWIATLWAGRLQLRTPLWFVIGFIAIFVLGGLTGVMLASVPIDLQVHDTYFVVAHLHYVLIGGAVFPLFGALYYWFPKLTGRLLHEGAGKWNCALMFVGFNLTFFPMHILGLNGMPRRVYTYLPESGFGRLSLLALVGAFVLGVGILVFLANVMWSLRHGEVAGADPWHGDTLEWSVPSPLPSYTFESLPTVRGRSPLWHPSEDERVVTGVAVDKPEVLITTLVDAAPDHRLILPGRSLTPLLLSIAMGITVIACIFNPWGLVWGAPACAAALVAWFWPSGRHRSMEQLR